MALKNSNNRHVSLPRDHYGSQSRPVEDQSETTNEPLRFGKRNLRVYKVDLSVAGEITINAAGTTVWFIRSTNTTDVAFIRYDDASQEQVPYIVGNFVQGIPFQKLMIQPGAGLVPGGTIAGATGFIVVISETPGVPLRIQ